MRLALYQPDIPPNVGTMLRLAACLGVGVDLIEPCGFPLGDRDLKRAGMDYLGHVALTRHRSWDHFLESRRGGRLLLLTTGAELPYWRHDFAADDVVLVGRETSGVPAPVHAAADRRLKVPMRPGMRSLNVAVAAAMVLGEGLRQTAGFP